MIAQLVIITAVCVGGWVTFVQAPKQELRELESRIEIAGHAGTQLPGVPLETAVGGIGEARRRLAEIRQRNEVSRNSSQLYGLIMDLAAERDIVVRRLQPSGNQYSVDGDRISVNRIEMLVEGGFEPVAMFVEAIEQIPGFLRPSHLQVTPFQREGEHMVAAGFTCEALRFESGEVLAQLEGPDHVEP
jgi:hypothetical protein